MPLISLEPEQLDLTVTQGATFRYQHTYRVRGAAPSLAGYSALMGIARRPGTPVLVTPTVTLEPNGALGVIDISMTAEQTSKLNRDCKYDLVLLAPDGTVTRALEGTVFVRRAVTPVEV